MGVMCKKLHVTLVFFNTAYIFFVPKNPRGEISVESREKNLYYNETPTERKKMSDDQATLLFEIGKNVEEIGQKLQTTGPFSCHDLTALRDALNHSAESVQIARDTLFNLKY